jgi:hypothetical protein
MRMFTYTWNFGCNKLNAYTGTWGLHGNYWKNCSPNYMFSNELLLPYIISFFSGIDNVNTLLLNFNYEEEKLFMQEHNFKNCLAAWTRDGVKKENGDAYGSSRALLTRGVTLVTEDIEFGEKVLNARGSGKGIPTPIAYKVPGMPEFTKLPSELISYTFNKCFSKTCQTSIPVTESSITCTTNTGAISPYEGQYGMMLEFNSTDLNTRSSLFHCSLDFILVTTAITTLKLLNMVDITKEPYWDAVKVGMEDYLFKKENNYIGYSMGRIEPEDPVDITIWKEYWVTHYR